MFGNHDDEGDGYQIHGSRKIRWQENIGWTSSSTVYPTWATALLEQRRRLRIALNTIEDRLSILRDRSSEASKYRWQTRDDYDAAARNRSISDDEVAVLSNTAWWAEQDFFRADKAYNALFKASYQWQEKLSAIDKSLEKIAVTTPQHWHSSNCGICKDSALALAEAEEKGSRD